MFTKTSLYSLALARIALGWMFLRAFFDKLWGLGFATTSDKAWLAGVSPTAGFLSHAAKGPFVELFNAMSGSHIVEWLFMLGLLGIGAAFVFGIATRFAGLCGALLVALMFLSLIPPTNNPLIDEHVIYFFVFIGFAFSNVGDYLGFGNWWRSTKLVSRFRFLA